MDNSPSFIDLVDVIVELRLEIICINELTDEEHKLINTCCVLNYINYLMRTYITDKPLEKFKTDLKPKYDRCKLGNPECICQSYNFN